MADAQQTTTQDASEGPVVIITTPTLERTPVRILIHIPRKSRSWEAAWTEPDAFIRSTIKALGEQGHIPSETPPSDDDTSARLLITKISPRDTRIVFDMLHDTFDAVRAHEYGQDLPVIICVLVRSEGDGNKTQQQQQQQRWRSRRRRMIIQPAPEAETRRVNFEIRAMFNRYGHGCEPPFREDGRNGSSYSIHCSDYRDWKMYLAQEDEEVAAERARKRGRLQQRGGGSTSF